MIETNWHKIVAPRGFLNSSPDDRAIPTKQGVNEKRQGELKIHLPASAVNSSDNKEFIANRRHEKSVDQIRPERRFFEHVLQKSDFIRTFRITAAFLDVSDGQTVLELGASHCWASVLVKSNFPQAYVVASDLVPECVSYASGYERTLGVRLDEKWAFSVRDMPFADAQFDRIFTFAAFHHFGDRGDYSQPMSEIARILKPGGKLLLLYEPASPALLYKPAFRRVNGKRQQEGVDEDVLVISRLRRVSEGLGLSLRAEPFPIFNYRESTGSSIYYFLLAKLRLGKLMVCTANIVIEKPQ